MSAKRKPRTPSPLEDDEKDEGKADEDVFAGRRLSVSEFEGHEFDYDDVRSPGASSTSSEPPYVRQPGFEYHAHEFKAPGYIGERARRTDERKAPGGHSGPSSGPAKVSKKKKSSETREGSEGIRSDGDCTAASCIPARPKIAARPKEPVPMKLRALPQSFWLQPNKSNNVPPSYSLLPPLILGKDTSDVLEVRPVTPPTEAKESEEHRSDSKNCAAHTPSPTLSHKSLPSSSSVVAITSSASSSASSSSSHSHPLSTTMVEKKGERIIKVGNTDLLFRLFDTVEQGEKKKAPSVRRGRPRKATNTLPRVLRDEDPCLVSSVADSILPLLSDSTPNSSGSSTPLGVRQHQGQQVLEMVSLRDGNRTISLPSLNVEHNYNQILSELVMKL